MEHCDACGFHYADTSATALPGALTSASEQVAESITGVDDRRLRTRPEADVWSALEYTCHVRDMLKVQRARLALMLIEDCPALEPMGREERVIRDRYNEQDAEVVAAELRDAAAELADAFRALAPEEWERTAIYNWPVRKERSALWIGRHTLHELVHHRADIEAVSGGRRP